MGDRDALGRAGAARGEDDVGEGVGGQGRQRQVHVGLGQRGQVHQLEAPGKHGVGMAGEHGRDVRLRDHGRVALRRQGRVQGDVGMAGEHRTEDRRVGLEVVVGHHGDVRAGRQIGLGQARAHAREAAREGPVVVLGTGDPEGRALGEAPAGLGDPFQHRSRSFAPDPTARRRPVLAGPCAACQCAKPVPSRRAGPSRSTALALPARERGPRH